ncbi:O-antigen ligase family protein [Arsenicicoccus dermatophilus]|uniref:O-antigen ligase family protein n=1 Tax=Arsenicicoccus dermatophilus TaxID=1076331 RepID=UPI003916EF19
MTATAVTAAQGTDDVVHGTERIPAFVWVTLAYLATNMFSGVWGELGVPAPLDRGLLLLALLLVALDPFRERLRWRPVYGWMIATVLWTTWSALTADTLTTPEGLYGLLDRVVVPFVMFPVGALVFATPRRRDLILKLLVLIGLYLGTNAVFTILGPHSLVYPRYIMTFVETNPLVAGDNRAVGPFLTAEANGFTLNLCVYAAGFAVHRFRGWWRRLALLAIPVCLAGVMLTLTRSAWLACVLGLVSVCLFVPRLRRWLIPSAIGAAVLLGAAVLAIPALNELVTSRATTSRSLYDRANTYEAGWRALEQHPLWGVGWSTFIDHGVEWVRQSPDYPVTTVTIEIHNVFMSRAVETGFIGGALWIVCCAAGPFARLLRGPDRRTPELFGWWLFALMSFFAWIVPSMTSPNPFPLPNILTWLIGGIVARAALVRPRGAPNRDDQDDAHPDEPHLERSPSWA